MSKKVVVQVSGGIDSTVMLAWALSNRSTEDVYPITFEDSSPLWRCKDLIVLRRIMTCYKMNHRLFECTIPQVDMLEMPHPDGMETGVIPGYKLFMNAASLAYARKVGAQEVWVGNMADNTYPDELPEFNKRLEDLFHDTYGGGIKIKFPLVDIDILKLGVSLKVNFAATLSCSSNEVSGTLNCGTCTCCLKRKARFIKAGLFDPTQYLR